MSNKLERSYYALIEFLLSSKHEAAMIGAKHGLTLMQTMTLIMLEDRRTMTYFKKLFNCDASNITGLVDGLEQKKLAERCDDENDRRIKMVKLTTSGRKLRSKIITEHTGPQSYINAKLSPAELTTFIELLEKITAKA